MGFFSVALSSAMKSANGMGQSELKRRSKASQSQISGWLNRGILPDGESLVKLCAVFPSEAAALVCSWLRDKLPDELSSLVDIRAGDSSSRVNETPDEPSGYSRLPETARRLLDEVSEKCARNPRFLAAIESTVSLTRI